MTWTNRWETSSHVVPVRSAGEYSIAVSLGPNAAKFAENAAVGVVLRVDVIGDEPAGPQHDAPVVAKSDKKADNKGGSAAHADSGEAAGAGWTGTVTAAVGGAVVLAAGVRVRGDAAQVGHEDDKGWRVKRQRSRGRVASAALAALCAVAALPGQAWAAGEPSPYTYEPSAQPVKGAVVNTDAEQLKAGGTYKDSIKPGGKLFYRVVLDAKSNAYVSATAVPKLGTKVSYADELKVTLQDRDGNSCNYGTAQFQSAEFARPVGTYAHRTIDKDSTSCQEADTYYVLVERDSEATSSSEPWDLEIRHLTEPGLKAAGPTAAPENWPSASPEPPTGGPQERRGGTSFFSARGLKEGEWRDKIKPGETLFYKVPVDWGQQLFASADLSSAAGEGYVPNALAMAVYNPARGLVDSASDVAYDGKQKSTALDPLPPVAYENRFDSKDSVNGMRFAGWYYLRVSLNPAVEKEFGSNPLGLSLRLNVKGDAQSAPGYAGPAGDFEVTDDHLSAAESGQSSSEAEKSGTMQLVAAAGIGAGTVLVLGLGVWMLVARRRAAAGPPSAGQGADSGAPTQYGPPAAW